MKRRTFVKSAGIFSMLSSLSINTLSWTGEKLDILVLGGRDFLGPAIVNAAIEGGHQVTLFNRGITNPQMFEQLPLIKGDRKTGKSCYTALQKKKWDVIIDVWPEHSSLVDDATNELKDYAAHYIFISSIAVYQDYSQIGLNEQSELVGLPEDHTTWGYSEEKTRSEQLVKERFPDRHTIFRPGPIKGWRDPAVDVAYWLLRFQMNDQVLAPGSGMDPIQFIDVKDVGAFAVKSAEENHYGIFNTTGPRKTSLVFKEFLESCKTYTNSKAEIVWVEESFLRENKVRSFDDLPLWIPLSEDPGFMQISSAKADQYGFNYTDLDHTYRDILDWYGQGLGGTHQFGRQHNSVGLTAEQEQGLLAKWQG